MKNIKDTVIKIVQQYAPNETQNINLKTKLSQDLGYDSIAFVSLVVSLENELHFSFDDEYLDIQKINEVKHLLDYVIKKVEKDES